MVNEDTKQPSNTASSSPPSSTENVPGDSGPTLAKTGEIMLIFALIIVFLVIFFVAVHLAMKKRSKRFWGGIGKGDKSKKKKKGKDIEAQTSELHSVDKDVFEVADTAVTLCELPPDAPPLQELEADMMFSPLERPRSEDSSTLDLEISPADNPWPEGRELAVYWSARL